MLNQILAGHYQIIRTLGEGGWAKTYIAEDLHRPGHPKCVVKYLKPTSDDAKFLLNARRLFQKEAVILEKLGQHSQIPRLLAYFEHDREFYLVQEFIDGFTLTTELPPGHCWTESKVIQFLKDVLSILEFVHRYGVIHRDIKPCNLIRRNSDGRLVLIDFGAVKEILGPRSIAETTFKHTTIAIGTQGYMPTEQARGKPRLNSDLYALGMIGIQALTGLNPLLLQENEEGEVIWQDQAQVSPELARILSQMVAYHFRDRYQSSTEVLQDLNPLISQDFSSQATSEQEQTQPREIVETLLAGTKIVSEAEILDAPVEVAKSPVAPLLEVSNGSAWPATRIIPENSYPEAAATLLEEINIISETTPLPETQISFSDSPWEKSTAIPEPEFLSINKIFAQKESRNSEVKSIDRETLLVPDAHLTEYFLLPESPPEILRDDSFRRTNAEKNTWLIGGGIVAVLASLCLIGSYGYSYWSARRALEQTRSLETATRYSECVQEAKKVSPQYSQLYTEAQELMGKCSLAQAQKRLDRGAEQIWQTAKQKYRQGNLNEAIASAMMIPPNSSLSPQAEKAIQKWQQEWEDNETYLQASQQALNNQQWSKAIEEAKKISDHSYWQKQAKSIIDRANAEIAKSEQGQVMKAKIRPRTSAVRTSRPKTSTVPTSRPKTSSIQTSRSRTSTVPPSRPKKTSIVRTSRPTRPKVDSYRKAPSRSPRSSNVGIPRDTSPACSGGQC